MRRAFLFWDEPKELSPKTWKRFVAKTCCKARLIFLFWDEPKNARRLLESLSNAARGLTLARLRRVTSIC